MEGTISYKAHQLNGVQPEGAVIRVMLSGPAYVRLVDYRNFQRYRMGRDYSYWGGISRRMDFMFRIPKPGKYLVIVDTERVGGVVESTIEQLGLPLPGMKEFEGVVDLPKRGNDV